MSIFVKNAWDLKKFTVWTVCNWHHIVNTHIQFALYLLVCNYVHSDGNFEVFKTDTNIIVCGYYCIFGLSLSDTWSRVVPNETKSFTINFISIQIFLHEQPKTKTAAKTEILFQMFFLCVCSAAFSHHSELLAVFAVTGDVLLVLHPLWRLHWEQGLHQHQHAALHCSFRPLRLTSDPGEELLRLSIIIALIMYLIY